MQVAHVEIQTVQCRIINSSPENAVLCIQNEFTLTNI